MLDAPCRLVILQPGKQDVSEKIIGLVEAQYRAFSCRALHNDVLSDHNGVVAEVRQRCTISLRPFLIVIDELPVGAIDLESNRGLQWQPITSEHLNDFELADDVALLAQRRSNIQIQNDDLANRSSAARLTINANKTKSLDVNTVNPSSFMGAGQAVDNVESSQYMGSQMAVPRST